MRLHRFHIPETIGTKTELTVHSAELTHQIRHVFRLRTGDSVILFDGSGSDFECVIANNAHPDKESITFNVTSTQKSHYMPERTVCLCAAIVKKDTFEWIVEKATELGVTHVIPIVAERSEKKSLNMERLNKIVTEASEQSGRGSVPFIAPIMTLEESVATLKNVNSETSVIKTVAGDAEPFEFLSFHTDATAFERSDVDGEYPLAIFIGPEGGWTLNEIDLFNKESIPVKSLGNQVLRAETAVVAGLAVVMMG